MGHALSQVRDGDNDSLSKLGDFHYKGTQADTGYRYDGNGNLILDNNKGIDLITYNYLNLPDRVHFKGKGDILYGYDNGGNKLFKTVMDSVTRHATKTIYVAGFVYQQIDTITNPGGGPDTLQFLQHEEGRLRWAQHYYQNGTTKYGWENDVFEKDHLGNTRMVLTTQKDTANYAATMESAYRAKEKALFYNITETSYLRTLAGYPVDTSMTNPNDSVIMLNGAAGRTQGPAIILKVMAGDTIDLGAKAYYTSLSGTGTTPSITDVLTSLASGVVGITAGGKGAFGDLNTSSSPLYGALNSFMTNKDGTVAGKPRAYLNYMFLDDQYQYDATNSGAKAVGNYTAGTLSTLAQSGIVAGKNGFLYVWVSNETQGWPVFFDNLSVQVRSGPILEETHYYPFGLTMAGISDKALKGRYAENKFKANYGSELQNKEFNDGSGLEAYDATFRMYDPQIGRFWQQDPLGELAEGWNPYAFVLDNPISYVDPLGDTATLPAVTVTPMPVHKPNNTPPSLALIGDPPGGVNLPPAPTKTPDIPINEPEAPPDVAPLRAPEVEPIPLPAMAPAALTAVLTLIPITGNTDWPNGNELFPKEHPEFWDKTQTPSKRNKPIKDLYLVRFGDGPESAKELEANASKALANGYPHGVSTFLRANTSPNGRYAKLLDVMNRFEIKKTGKPDHFTVVLPNPVTEKAALDFDLLFIKR
jgi:RHS repeat-associated protein